MIRGFKEGFRVKYTYLLLIIIFFSILIRLVSGNEDIPKEERVPFLTLKEQESLDREKMVDEEPELLIDTSLIASGIVYSECNRRVIINGRILSEADIINNMEVIKIEPEKVIFKSGDKKYFINLPEILRTSEQLEE